MVQLRKNALKHGFHRVNKASVLLPERLAFLHALHLRHPLNRFLRSAIRIQFYRAFATPESVTPSGTEEP